MPQQTPQVPDQSDRAEDARWDLPGRLRQDILSSWKRSLLAGLAPERFTVPHVTDVDEDGPLVWTAAPVMTRIAEDLEGTGIGILLADSRGHIISRTSGDRHVLRWLDQAELAPGSLFFRPCRWRFSGASSARWHDSLTGWDPSGHWRST